MRRSGAVCCRRKSRRRRRRRRGRGRSSSSRSSSSSKVRAMWAHSIHPSRDRRRRGCRLTVVTIVFTINSFSVFVLIGVAVFVVVAGAAE